MDKSEPTVFFKIEYPKTKKGKTQWNKEYGMNSIYAGKHWAKRKKDSEYWHLLVKSCISKQIKDAKIFKNPVSIIFWWNDNLDLSNHSYESKMIEDSMKGILIKDDDRRYVKEIHHVFHDEDYILVAISEMKGE